MLYARIRYVKTRYRGVPEAYQVAAAIVIPLGRP
jgi:hypothetical protein